MGPISIQRSPSSEKASGERLRPPRILIADDEMPIANAMARTLKEGGYSFAFAQNGVEALRMYQQERFDLVISDRRMPIMGGLELVRRLKGMDPGAKIMVMSGGISSAETLEFLNSGALCVMEKPFDQAGLKNAVAAALSVSSFAKERPANEGLRGRKSLNVLFVDDDLAIRESMSDVLPMMGHTCKVASDGKEALEMLAAEPFDVVISDFHMPNMSGLEMLKVIRKERPDFPVIMAFAATGDDDVEIVMEAGASAVLNKPMDLDKLERAISKACGR